MASRVDRRVMGSAPPVLSCSVVVSRGRVCVMVSDAVCRFVWFSVALWIGVRCDGACACVSVFCGCVWCPCLVVPVRSCLSCFSCVCDTPMDACVCNGFVVVGWCRGCVVVVVRVS